VDSRQSRCGSRAQGYDPELIGVEETPVEPAFLNVGESLSGRRWRARPHDPRQALAISEILDVPEVLGRVLAARGVTIETCESYLAPSMRDDMPDPSLLKDMDLAAQRLARAITDGERVTVFGDYDVDGATSAAVLKRYFEMAGGTLEVYVPDRLREGYGPNAAALERIAANGAKIVVTVDCGIVAHDALAAGVAAGLETIVVDHHAAEPALPPALAVVNPNRLDQEPGLGHLAAVGVAFLLVVALNRALRAAGWFSDGRTEPSLLSLLDLVALGTVCDVVPIRGFNRALVAQGLKVARQLRNPGVAALAAAAGVRERIDAYHLGFVLGPRVNAGGRVGASDLGARLLSTNDPIEAREIAEQLDRHNQERRMIEDVLTQEALEQAEGLRAADPIIVVDAQGWHPGVIGIVASRLKDRFDRPALVIGSDGAQAKGSARSVPGFDIGATVIAARQEGLLVNGGGHPMAAGLTVESAKIDALRDFLCTRAAVAVAARAPQPVTNIDGALAVEGATTDLVTLLEKAGPYGAGNREPRFALTSARIIKPQVVGEKHVRCFLAGEFGRRVKAIAFRCHDQPLGLGLLSARDERYHVAGHLRADTWGGRDEVQLTIEDAARA